MAKLPDETRKLAFELLLLGLSQSDTARKLHISRRALCKWIEQYPEIRDELLERDRQTVADIRAKILEVANRPIGEITPAVHFKYIELQLKSVDPEKFDPAVRRNEYMLAREDARRLAEAEVAMRADQDEDPQDDIELGTFIEVWERRLLESAAEAAKEADDYDETKPIGRKPNGANGSAS